jgi:hypothetical protein
MIIIRPHDSDWQTIQDETGDATRAPREMDKYFARVERWRHRSAAAASHGRPIYMISEKAAHAILADAT